MASLPSSNTTTTKTSMSGLSKQPRSGRVQPPKAAARPVKLPPVLAYPKLHPLSATSAHIKDRLCYVVRHYGNNGLAVLVVREPNRDKTAVLCGDWYGKNLDLDGDSTDPVIQSALVFIREDFPLFLKTMQLIKLNQAQFFLALDQGQLTLVDIQTTIDKLAGPGMVRDIFGKIYRTQEIIKIEAIDDRAIEFIEKGTGNYEGNLIIKPSQFRTFSPNEASNIVPLYTEIIR